MPFTLFHYPFGYLASKIDKRLILSALLVGSVMPDIEVPILFLFFTGVVPDHLILHSLIGTLTIGLLLTVAVTKFIYPPLIGFLFKIDREKLKEACRVTPRMILSCAFGLMLHIGVDYLHHWFNPLFWPWIDPFLLVGPLVSFFATLFATDIHTGFSIANGFTNITLLIVLFWIIRVNKEDRWNRLWLGT